MVLYTVVVHNHTILAVGLGFCDFACFFITGVSLFVLVLVFCFVYPFFIVVSLVVSISAISGHCVLNAMVNHSLAQLT